MSHFSFQNTHEINPSEESDQKMVSAWKLALLSDFIVTELQILVQKNEKVFNFFVDMSKCRQNFHIISKMWIKTQETIFRLLSAQGLRTRKIC